MYLSRRTALFLTVYIIWYSRKNTTFQKVILCLGLLDAEDKGTVILRNVADC